MVPIVQSTINTPTREILGHTSTLREYIYRRHSPGGEAIPVLVQLVSILDDTLERYEIVVAVWRLHMRR